MTIFWGAARTSAGDSRNRFVGDQFGFDLAQQHRPQWPCELVLVLDYGPCPAGS